MTPSLTLMLPNVLPPAALADAGAAAAGPPTEFAALLTSVEQELYTQWDDASGEAAQREPLCAESEEQDPMQPAPAGSPIVAPPPAFVLPPSAVSAKTSRIPEASVLAAPVERAHRESEPFSQLKASAMPLRPETRVAAPSPMETPVAAEAPAVMESPVAAESTAPSPAVPEPGRATAEAPARFAAPPTPDQGRLPISMGEVPIVESAPVDWVALSLPPASPRESPVAPVEETGADAEPKRNNEPASEGDVPAQVSRPARREGESEPDSLVSVRDPRASSVDFEVLPAASGLPRSLPGESELTTPVQQPVAQALRPALARTPVTAEPVTAEPATPPGTMKRLEVPSAPPLARVSETVFQASLRPTARPAASSPPDQAAPAPAAVVSAGPADPLAARTPGSSVGQPAGKIAGGGPLGPSASPIAPRPDALAAAPAPPLELSVVPQKEGRPSVTRDAEAPVQMATVAPNAKAAGGPAALEPEPFRQAVSAHTGPTAPMPVAPLGQMPEPAGVGPTPATEQRAHPAWSGVAHEPVPPLWDEPKVRAPVAVQNVRLEIPHTGGGISLTLRHNEGRIEVWLGAEDRDLRQFLRSEISDLVGRLEHAGYEIDLPERLILRPAQGHQGADAGEFGGNRQPQSEQERRPPRRRQPGNRDWTQVLKETKWQVQ